MDKKLGFLYVQRIIKWYMQYYRKNWIPSKKDHILNGLKSCDYELISIFLKINTIYKIKNIVVNIYTF